MTTRELPFARINVTKVAGIEVFVACVDGSQST
jgi:hypothetical protein